MKRTVFLALVSLLFTLARGAVIKGFVKEKGTKEPLIGCNVYLENTGLGSSSNKEGYYVITGIKEGEYKIIFSYVGYKEVSKNLSVKRDTTITLNIELEREIIKLPEIKVQAKRSEFEEEVNISATKLSPIQLKSFPNFLEGDLIRSLQYLPGVVTANDFSAALYVRGGAADQNLILLDGVNIYNPFHIGGLFSVFDISALQGAEFLTGGFPAEYGGRLSSVLDVDVKEGNKETYQGKCGVGLLSARFLGEGPLLREKSSFFFSFRRTYFDKALSLFNINFPYYFYDLHLKANLEISPKTKVFFSGFINSDIFDFGFRKTRIYFDWGNRTASIFLRHIFHPQVFTKTYLTFSRYLYNIDIAEEVIWVKDWINEYSLKSDGIYFITSNNELKFGLEGKINECRYQTSVLGFSLDIKAFPRYLNFYLSDKWKPIQGLILETGLRLDNSFVPYQGQKVTHHLLSPRLGVKYFILEDLAGKIALGRFTQFITALLPEYQPAPFLYVWVPSFGPHKPQVANHFIAGIEKWFGEELNLTVEGYYKKYERIQEYNEKFDPLNIEATILREGKGEAYGFDFLAKRELGRLTGWLAYSYSKVLVKFGARSYFPFYDRRHNFNLVGMFSLPKGYALSGRFVYTTGSPYTEPVGHYRDWYWGHRYERWAFYWGEIPGEKNNARYPPYHRLDLGMEKEWRIKNTNLIGRLEVINVYNQRNVLFFYYDYEKSPPVKKAFSMLPIFPSLSLEWQF